MRKFVLIHDILKSGKFCFVVLCWLRVEIHIYIYTIIKLGDKKQALG